MEADKKIKPDCFGSLVFCFDLEEAWCLVQQKVEQEAVSWRQDITKLPEKS